MSVCPKRWVGVGSPHVTCSKMFSWDPPHLPSMSWPATHMGTTPVPAPDLYRLVHFGTGPTPPHASPNLLICISYIHWEAGDFRVPTDQGIQGNFLKTFSNQGKTGVFQPKSGENISNQGTFFSNHFQTF